MWLFFQLKENIELYDVTFRFQIIIYYILFVMLVNLGFSILLLNILRSACKNLNGWYPKGNHASHRYKNNNVLSLLLFTVM